ncbi:MAG: hypothetical protein M3Y58_00920 [Chloroflexota bacterium]|nr:hypothetical protein [Chloroflexota bacterium]
MNSEERPIPPELTQHVRETMTADETRHAHDDAYNVFAALEEEDADVLFVLANRSREYGATDLDSFIKGYEAGLRAHRTSREIDEIHASGPRARSA